MVSFSKFGPLVEGFGIDTDGLLWVWPTSSRPVSAELVSVSLRREVRSRLASVEDPGFILVEDGEEIEVLVQEEASREVLASVNEVQEVGISDLGVSFKAGITWAIDDSDAGHLWQLKRAKSKGSWLAERFEYLAQVSCFACGPEHQAAVTSYTVPTSHSEEKGLAVSELGDASGAVVRDGAVCAVRSVPSLQQVCEEKLCAKLNPRSFGLVCDIAWELNRPALLDRAFGFLCANAPLMFSKLHLPTLSQLPIEVLAAFEMAAKAKQKLKVAKVTVPSETPIEKEVRRESLQEACPQDFGFDIDLEDPILRELIHLCENGQWSVVSSAALSLLATSMLGTAAGEGLVAEKLGLSFALSEIERVELEAETEKEEAQVKGQGKTSLMSLDDGPSRHLRLTDFMPRSGKGKEGKREAKTPEAGPSAILVSAVESAGKDGAWALPNVEQSPLSDILEAHSKEKSKTSKAKTGSKPTPKVMTCSWGRDALPSEQTKNQSISEIQQEEELLREHDEILEIEARLYQETALEVAEIEEALEQSRVANGEPKVSQPQVKSQKKAEPRSKKRAERSTSGQLGRSQHSNRSERVLDWWAQSDWSGWSWDSWDSGKTARWQKRDPGRPGPAPDEATQRDE
ncbi:RCC1 and BTB domain-containing protein 2 [Durusdinium trenchii]|uniref:RCC1 and BTB domain-containing protein 2 n=1 Tax=Durusdinium trenchii TaxID=1381693 RepID=A0ABP0R7N4_9DINO